SSLGDDGGAGVGGREAGVLGRGLLLVQPGMCRELRSETRGLRGPAALSVTSPTGVRLMTVVLDISGLHYATEKAVVESVLSRRPGVHRVDANPVSQTATVAFD